MPYIDPATTPYYGGGQVRNPLDSDIIHGTPNVKDVHHNLGYTLINPTTGQVYMLTNTAGGSATYAALGGGSSNVNTLQGDAGGGISPVGETLSWLVLLLRGFLPLAPVTPSPLLLPMLLQPRKGLYY